MEGINAEAFMNFLNQITAFQANLSKRNAKPNQDSTSIYYLHPSDGIGTPLSTITIDGKNYGDWSIAILWGLKGKNKVRFVDGSLPRPDKDDENFEAWDRYTVKWIDSEWQNYRRSFLQLGKKTLIYGLGIMRQYRIEDQVTRFLRGLNEQFSNVRSQIILLDPLPNVNTLLCMLTQQKHGFLNMDINPEVKIAYAATPSNTANPGNDRGKGRGRGGRSQGGRGKVQCSHCGKLGHSIDVCYKKHDYPSNFKERNAAEGAGNFAASLVTKGD
ncbi:uncharacterized protein [Arachis hypogaea]|uniref:uncharacterized protein n=1 Tax=Arachis hypogaea TaxID=3818 RepID=UPI003B220F39